VHGTVDVCLRTRSKLGLNDPLVFLRRAHCGSLKLSGCLGAEGIALGEVAAG
jgi:hypothetical protein